MCIGCLPQLAPFLPRTSPVSELKMNWERGCLLGPLTPGNSSGKDAGGGCLDIAALSTYTGVRAAATTPRDTVTETAVAVVVAVAVAAATLDDHCLTHTHTHTSTTTPVRGEGDGGLKRPDLDERGYGYYQPLLTSNRVAKIKNLCPEYKTTNTKFIIMYGF